MRRNEGNTNDHGTVNVTVAVVRTGVDVDAENDHDVVWCRSFTGYDTFLERRQTATATMPMECRTMLPVALRNVSSNPTVEIMLHDSPPMDDCDWFESIRCVTASYTARDNHHYSAANKFKSCWRLHARCVLCHRLSQNKTLCSHNSHSQAKL
jgi:hypothetical protein